jgi:hypothetical protein
MACPSQPPCRFDTKVESQIQHSEKPADSVNPENALVRDLADMGLDAKDIAEIRGWPLKSVRTLLMPTRRK